MISVSTRTIPPIFPVFRPLELKIYSNVDDLDSASDSESRHDAISFGGRKQGSHDASSARYPLYVSQMWPARLDRMSLKAKQSSQHHNEAIEALSNRQRVVDGATIEAQADGSLLHERSFVDNHNIQNTQHPSPATRQRNSAVPQRSRFRNTARPMPSKLACRKGNPPVANRESHQIQESDSHNHQIQESNSQNHREVRTKIRATPFQLPKLVVPDLPQPLVDPQVVINDSALAVDNTAPVAQDNESAASVTSNPANDILLIDFEETASSELSVTRPGPSAPPSIKKPTIQSLVAASSTMVVAEDSKSRRSEAGRGSKQLPSLSNLHLFKRKKSGANQAGSTSPLSDAASPSSTVPAESRLHVTTANSLNKATSTQNTSVSKSARSTMAEQSWPLVEGVDSPPSLLGNGFEAYLQSPGPSPISFREQRASRRFSYPEISPLPTLRACDVCSDEHPVAEFSSPPGSNCKHVGKTCRTCIATWIATSLESRGWESIRCPDCREALEQAEIKQFATKEVFERYDKLRTRAYVSAIKDFHWCVKPGCESGQLHNPQTQGQIMRCHACHFMQCPVHERAWHTGETCSQYDARMKEESMTAEERRAEAQSRATLERISKPCPNGACGARIQKNEGCDHMTCAKCKHQFCWICFAPYDAIRHEGNHRHRFHCGYYAAYRPR